MKNIAQKTTYIILSLLIVASMLLAGCKASVNNENEIRYDIVFGDVPDHWDISKVKIDYDIKSLKAKIPRGPWNVYKAITIEDYAEIAGKLGFSEDHIVSTYSDSVSYRDENDMRTRRLIVWSTGCFSYETGIKETTFETALSERDYIELSKEVIKEYGWRSDLIDDECTVSISMSTNPSINESKITGYTIHLYYLFDGKTMLGEPRLNIKFNGNGEVVTIWYYMPDFEKIGSADVKTLNQALTCIKDGNAPMAYGLEKAPDRITINDVELCYYSQRDANDEVYAQPVYFFDATGHYETGDEPFKIVVQAN